MVCGVYKIGFNNTDKVYIGSSKDIDKRIKQHKAMLKEDCHHSYKLQNYFNKNKSELYYEILLECDENIRTFHEAEYISKFNAIEAGFNVAPVQNIYNPKLVALNNIIVLPEVIPLYTKLLNKNHSSLFALVGSYIKYNYEVCKIKGIDYGETYDSIAEKLKISSSSTRATIKQLIELGIISLINKGSTYYNMNFYKVENI